MFTSQNQTSGQPLDLLNSYRLPARLDVDQVAALLGFAQHDMQILMREKLLQPLGKSAPNAPKRFAACTIEQLRLDIEWLNRATRTVCTYWKNKRERLRARNARPDAPDGPPETA